MIRIFAFASLLAAPAVAQPLPTIMLPPTVAPYVAYVGIGGGGFSVNSRPGFISAMEAASIIQPVCAARGMRAHAEPDQRTRLISNGRTDEILLTRRVTCR